MRNRPLELSIVRLIFLRKAGRTSTSIDLNLAGQTGSLLTWDRVNSKVTLRLDLSAKGDFIPPYILEEVLKKVRVPL